MSQGMSPGRSPHRHASASIEQLRLAVALAHSVPGVVLDLRCSNGEHVAVAAGLLGTQLTPCELRCALLAPPEPGLPRLVDAITSVEVAGGVDHLGLGLYARGPAGIGSERWFVTTLSHPRIAELLSQAPADLPHASCAVRLAPDRALGVTAVGVTATAGAGTGALDEVAYWALAACLVDELIDPSHPQGSTNT
jgi:hypothetical protein